MRHRNLKSAVTSDGKSQTRSGGLDDDSYWFSQFDLLPGSHSASRARVRRRRRHAWHLSLQATLVRFIKALSGSQAH